MAKNMLIDSTHLEEIRVAVIDDDKLCKFDFEIPSKTQIKGNIYLAKIVRVEPSLQAAFVDYGNEKHGFLSFSEIHNDYFQIPIEDRNGLEDHIKNATAELMAKTGGFETDQKEISKLRYQFYRRYKIQEVIKKRQIILVQVTKEERGNKGAALTTYISLAGRYCVFMPNMTKESSISKKIIDSQDRIKLKKIVLSLNMEKGSVVIRTAGIGHTKIEITKDFSYLKKMWDEIRETTLKSIAPCLIYEEASIIKRAIRDLYSPDIESIFIDGKEGYEVAKSFIKKLMPNHTKKIKLHEEKSLLFSKFKINDQIDQIYSTRVNLHSGGYLIINTTEALVSIDVNSGRSISDRNIAETALRTNLEAAKEIARQCCLRDLAGLIVVDFIDMDNKQHNTNVEKCLRDAMQNDKAKIQIGTISRFGLLEFSRQRMRPSIADLNMTVCNHCNGSGFTWSEESSSIHILRKVEEAVLSSNSFRIVVTLPANITLYLLNNKRSFISDIEKKADTKIIFKIDNTISVSDFKMEHEARPTIANKGNTSENDDEEGPNEIKSAIEKIEPRKKSNHRRRKPYNKNASPKPKKVESSEEPVSASNTQPEKNEDRKKSGWWKKFIKTSDD